MLYKRVRLLVLFILMIFILFNGTLMRYLTVPLGCRIIKDNSFSAGVIGYTADMYLIKGRIKESDLKEYPLSITLLPFKNNISMDGWKSCENIEYRERLDNILNTILYHKDGDKAYIIEFCSDVLKRKKDFYFVSYYRLDSNENSRSFGKEIYYKMCFLDIKNSKLYEFLWAF